MRQIIFVQNVGVEIARDRPFENLCVDEVMAEQALGK
jgi:hypothetical protein